MNISSTELDRKLCRILCDHPRKHKNRFTDEAKRDLIEKFFWALTNDREDRYCALLPDGLPKSGQLQDVQRLQEGLEYSAGAKGKACGHILKAGEATYHCMTCTDDATCVLCARCFNASDHEGHQFHVNTSPGNNGCCDCGDTEAFKRPVNCAIHTASEDEMQQDPKVCLLPEDLQRSMATTIGRVLDYFCDVISCSPENLRLAKTEESVKHDENSSRLNEKWYSPGDEYEANPEYCLVLWNDEKHTVEGVQHQVMRACREREKFGLDRANETNDIGRSVIRHSRDVPTLIKMCRILEQIKVTVTIRSSRDTFREQMCSTIIEWLSDIACCSIQGDPHVLRQVVCQEMTKEWRVGSEAPNAAVGKAGLFDNEREDREVVQEMLRRQQRFVLHQVRIAQQNIPVDAFDDDDDDEDPRPMDGNDMDTADGEEDEDEDEDDDRNDDMTERQTPRPNGILATELLTRHGIIGELIAVEADSGNEGLDGPEDGEEMDTDGDYMDLDVPVPDNVTNAQRQAPPQPSVVFTPTESESESGDVIMRHGQRETNTATPRLPDLNLPAEHEATPEYWKTKEPEQIFERMDPLLASDTIERLRLDSLILFDLRLWKDTRIKLRDLLISTVVNIPYFKRILGIRFAILYTTLSQLYLVADREPDHSVIHLSLQMLTSPSITEEVIEKGNFLATMMAILYTFLTTRQVGYPKDVDSQATLAFDTGSVTNRRLLSSFNDLRFILASDFVQRKIRSDSRYLRQFLDLAKLSQGICPNVRAIGEHVEYETDAWINASLLTKEINRLCRQFAESYREKGTKQVSSIEQTCGAIFDTACIAIVNAIGLERKRFVQNEIKEVTRFKTLQPFEFESRTNTSHLANPYRVVDFVIQDGALSFHHALHYTLSWLVEFARSSQQAIQALDAAATSVVQDLQKVEKMPPQSLFLLKDDALLAMFDYPLRLCAWLAQMKAGMWVRNGMSLRHQWTQYRGVMHRDVGHHRDLVLLQTALVACDPGRILASIIDRYGLEDWMRGNFTSPSWREDGQSVDLAEEFLFLLINLISDRDNLIPEDDETEPHIIAVRKDIVHTLCFKDLSFSELNARLTERHHDHQELQDILDIMTDYRPPEGLHDSGMFHLKPEYLRELDPYNSNFSKNQRDEAEAVYRKWMAKSTGKAPEDIVLEPNLRQIKSGVFTQLARVTRTPLFAQVIYYCLEYALEARVYTPDVPTTRIEALLHVVLQLALIATLEDELDEDFESGANADSFVHHALNLGPRDPRLGRTAIITILQQISNTEQYGSCRAKIKHLLRMFVRKREFEFNRVTAHLEFPYGRLDTASPANLESEAEAKKKQAFERKAKVMAQFQQQQQTFLNNQGAIDWGEDDTSETETDAASPTGIRTRKYPTGDCIHCREDVTADCRLYGTFAMVIESGVSRLTPNYSPEFLQQESHEDYVREIFHSPPSLDVSLEGVRPFGVSGWNHEQVRRLNASGEQTEIDSQCLGKGWPKSETAKSRIMTSCGHIMHFSCFENYYNSVARRQSHQISRNHPERLSQLEFVCPLCKADGNTFLPIAWKSTELSYPGSLNSDVSFDKALEVERALEYDEARLQRSFQISDLEQLMLTAFRDSRRGLTVNMSARDPRQPEELSERELQKIFTRLRDTLGISVHKRDLGSDHAQSYIEELVSCFADTISVTETAQRGVQSDYGLTLLSKVPQQTITHLRILASDIILYTALKPTVSRAKLGSGLVGDLQSMQVELMQQLRFHRSNDAFKSSTYMPLLMEDSFALLTKASITFKADPNLKPGHLLRIFYTAEIVRVIIAYFRTNQPALGAMASSSVAAPPVTPSHDIANFWEFCKSTENTWREAHFSETAQQSLPSMIAAAPGQPDGASISKLLRQYATVFLRKAMLLFHVSHNVDFPAITSESYHGLPELERLSRLLLLPSVSSILAELSQFHGANSMKKFVSGWLVHYLEYSVLETATELDSYEPEWYMIPVGVQRTRESVLEASAVSLRYSAVTDIYRRISLLHPCPLELIGLPKYFDVLMDLAHHRRCPTTGRDLTDPALCLLCGDIFCAQAVCCKGNGNLGGCNRHVAETKCGGGTIGMFLFIRKCMVALLHVVANPTATATARNKWLSSGSWFQAPYLTRYGEHDQGLRTREQLILSQKRYDKLYREAWLCVRGGSEVWSMIARKLEGDVNHGGWETL